MKLFKKIGAARNRLTHIGKNDPLNFLSIVVILALDFFVLWNIFQGLDLQTRQLTTAAEAVPYDCQQLVAMNNSAAKDWELVSSAYKNGGKDRYSRQYKTASSTRYINDAKANEVLPACRELFALAAEVEADGPVAAKMKLIEDKEREISRLQENTRNLEERYDTTLLETLANQAEELSITEGSASDTRFRIQNNTRQINQVKNDIVETKAQIIAAAVAQDFLTASRANRAIIKAEYDRLKFWYPLKELGFQLIFLAPLFLLFFVLYRHSVRHDKPLLTLIFSHLLVVVSIPIIIEVFNLLLQVLPFHFLKDFIALLDALGVVALWNYFLILFGIVAALGLIYVVQKKLFSRQRQMHKRIAKEQCCYCGVKLKEYHKHCFKCGAANLKNCQHCHELTFVEGANCRHCGKSEF